MDNELIKQIRESLYYREIVRTVRKKIIEIENGSLKFNHFIPEHITALAIHNKYNGKSIDIDDCIIFQEYENADRQINDRIFEIMSNTRVPKSYTEKFLR